MQDIENDKNKILFWEGDGEYGFLSNFSYIPVFYDNKKWTTSEHAYQAAKFHNPIIKEEILNLKTPDEAFKIGRNYKNILRNDWYETRVQIMEEIVSEKLKQNPYLNELLLKTGNKEIVESSTTDSFWGWGPNKDGENHMGKIWMKLREKIQNGSLNNMEKMLLTLCFVCKDSRILLGMKKRGFGAGQWNGFGGKVENGETIEETAIRELKEESGLEAEEISKMGIIEFRFQKDTKILEVHIFSCKDFNGIPVETEEMNPKWFNIEDIPYEKMWSDDIFWLPMLLDGKKFKGTFLFDKPSTKDYSAKIIRQELMEVEEL